MRYILALAFTIIAAFFITARLFMQARYTPPTPKLVTFIHFVEFVGDREEIKGDDGITVIWHPPFIEYLQPVYGDSLQPLDGGSGQIPIKSDGILHANVTYWIMVKP